MIPMTNGCSLITIQRVVHKPQQVHPIRLHIAPTPVPLDSHAPMDGGGGEIMHPQVPLALAPVHTLGVMLFSVSQTPK